MWPHRRQPTRLPHPWDSPGKNTGVVAISFCNAWKWNVKVKSLSCVWLLVTPWTAAYQAPPSMEQILDNLYKWHYIIYGVLWLLSSLSIMFSRFIHVAACISASSLFIAKYHSTCRNIPHFIDHSSVDGHLGCFHCFGGIVNNAAVNIGSNQFFKK